MKKTNFKMLLVGVSGLAVATLLQGCIVTPVAMARHRPYCYRCHPYWHRSNCWVNRWGVTRCWG